MDVSTLKIGDLTIDKGEIRKDVSLFAWDCIPACNTSTCPVVDDCGYIKRGKCAVQKAYLEALYSAIFDSYPYLDKTMLFKIGMQVIPLYMQLARLQMIELSLDSPIYTTDKGNLLPHPVLKEIRETLKTLHTMWKDLDLSVSFAGKVSVERDKEVVKDDGRGDPAYYERMVSGNGKSKKGVIR